MTAENERHTTIPAGSGQDQTKLAEDQRSIDATMLAGGEVDQAVLRQAEAEVQQEWQPGEVILGLYEVRRVSEGFGEDAVQKDFHEGGFGLELKCIKKKVLVE